MNGLHETKVCPHCVETIKTAAKVCPHCRRRLAGDRLKASEVVKLAFLILALTAPLVVGSYWVREVNEPGRSFDKYRDKIVIVESALHFGRWGNTNFISTVGYLRNESSVAWTDLQLEVQYFDAQGRLVDTRTETLADQELPAGVTAAFRIRAEAIADENDYRSNAIFVRTGKEARWVHNSGS